MNLSELHSISSTPQMLLAALETDFLGLFLYSSSFSHHDEMTTFDEQSVMHVIPNLSLLKRLSHPEPIQRA